MALPSDQHATPVVVHDMSPMLLPRTVGAPALQAQAGPGGLGRGDHGDDQIDQHIQRAEERARRRAFSSAVLRLPWLGRAVSQITETSGGNKSCYFQNFEKASVWAIPFKNTAFEVHDDIRIRFDQISGGVGILGCPLTDETNARDGIGRFNNFESGAIYWTPETKAWELYGDIGALWHQLDAERSWLGYPLGPEAPIGRGRWQSFQRGAVYWLPSAGAIALPASINDKYNSLGGPLGTLGFPIHDKLPVNTAPGEFFKFEKGKLVWEGTPQSIFVVMDAIYNFSVDKIECKIPRSRVQDTLFISVAIAMLGRDTLSVSKALGDHAEGFTFPSITIPNIPVGDQEVVVGMYTIANSGHADQGAALRTLESKTRDLAEGAAEIAGKKAGEAIGNKLAENVVINEAVTAVGAFIGGIIGTAVPGLGTIVGSALGALAGWIAGEIFDFLNPNCDGMVAEGHFTGTGQQIRELLSANGRFERIDLSPGSESPAGCGRTSDYSTTWSFTKMN